MREMKAAAKLNRRSIGWKREGVNEDIRGRCIDGRDKSQAPRARITVLDTDRKKGYEESSERAVCDAQL
jgi:hypothetical protein